jgi:hypothetical protein
MLETPEELERLQELLDESARSAGPHLSSVITPDRRLSAEDLCRTLQGMRLLVLATVTSDGRPLAGPVDGYFIHGAFHFSSADNSVRMRHISSRSAVSATHLPGEHLAVTVHGKADLYELTDPARPELRQAMLDQYLPSQGDSFAEFVEGTGIVAARIDPERMFTFHMAPS